MASFQLYLLLIVIYSYGTQGQITEGFRSCCAANLMDAGGRVVVDMYHGIKESGTFVALRALFCTTTKTYIQFWKPSGTPDGNNFTLAWQIAYTANSFGDFTMDMASSASPSSCVCNLGFVTDKDLNFGQPMKIDAGWKLGFFTPNGEKHSVPYSFQRPVYRSLISSSFYPANHNFIIGEEMHLDLLPWRRSFAVSVLLCKEVDCPDQSQVRLSPIFVPGVKGDNGVKGEKGDPGTCSPSFDQLNPDAINGVNEKVTGIQSDTQKLFELIEKMSKQIEELTQGNLITGNCPRGFVPGSYGLGYCYRIFRERRMSMIVAQMTCRIRFDAHLVDIQTEQEENFLRNEIIRLIDQTGDGDREGFWTSGMYSRSSSEWVWYQENRLVKETLIYDNFQNNAARTAGGLQQQCLKQTVDAFTKKSYWSASHCEEQNYFVCKTVKQCL